MGNRDNPPSASSFLYINITNREGLTINIELMDTELQANVTNTFVDVVGNKYIFFNERKKQILFCKYFLVE